MTLNYRSTMAACYIGYITQSIVNLLPTLLFVTFMTRLSVSLELLGLLVSVNFFIQFTVDIIAAKYADKIGYRVCIVTAHASSALGLVGLGVFPFLLPDPYIGLLVSIFFSALGSGLIEVLVSPVVEALPTKNKASSMSFLHSAYCWGSALVVLLSTLYFAVFGITHWQYLPMLWALVPFCNLFFFCKVPLFKLVEEEHKQPLRALASQRLFWLFLLLMICAGASEISMSGWSSLFAEKGLKLSKSAGDLMGPCVFAVMMGLIRIGFGIFGSKINLKKAIAASSLGCFLSYLLTVFAPNPFLSLIGCALCGLSVSIMWPGTLSLASRHFPKGGTALFAALALSGDLGCVVGPAIVGVMSDRVQTGKTVLATLFPADSDPVGAALKAGLLLISVFPLVMFTALLLLKKKQGGKTN